MKESAISRRTFLKTSAFAVGSYAILSRGTALAAPGSTGVTTTPTQYMKEFEWRIFVDVAPTKSDGSPILQGFSKVDVHDSTTNNSIADLTLNVVSVSHPDPSKTVTAQEKANGIPDGKTLLEVTFQQKGHIIYDGNVWTGFMHPNDARLPATADEFTVLVKQNLQFYNKQIGPWNEGATEPENPSDPLIKDNPDDNAAKNMSLSGTHLAMIAEWSEYGWTWIGAVHNQSNLKLNIAHLGSWTPGDEEAKTGTVVLVWSIQRCRRHRKMRKTSGSNTWESEANGSNQSGWSKWEPI